MVQKLRITLAFLCCLLCGGAFAQDSELHWTFDYHQFQYDMSAFIALESDGTAVTDYSGYEVAAFCGTELRGVGKVQTAEKDGVQKQYVYLRVWSNVTSGEDITFKVFVKSINNEVAIKNFSMPFVANSDPQGMPNSPVVLSFVPFIPGDVNNDGRVSSRDLVDLSKYFLSDRTVLCKNMSAADMDGNGTINNRDLIAISKYILTHN